MPVLLAQINLHHNNKSSAKNWLPDFEMNLDKNYLYIIQAVFANREDVNVIKPFRKLWKKFQRASYTYLVYFHKVFSGTVAYKKVEKIKVTH